MSYNSYWYTSLAFLSLVMLVYVLLKTKNYRNFLLFLVMVGTAYFIEFFIYVLFGSYQYYPKIILNNPYYDSNVGAYASNLLALPIAATFIAAFQLGSIWIFIFTAYFVGIEWLFLHLGIYSHNWWKLGYTAIGLPLYFTLAKWYLKWIMRPITGFLSSFILSFIIGAILGSLQIMPIMFLNIRDYHPGWFENPSRDTTAFAVVFYMSISIMFVIIVKIPWKNLLFRYALPVLLLFLVTVILTKIGVIQKHVWWDQLYYTSLSFFVLLATDSINKRLKNGPPNMKNV
jgi:hypothetical protein